MPNESGLGTDYLSLESVSHPEISTVEAAFGRLATV